MRRRGISTAMGCVFTPSRLATRPRARKIEAMNDEENDRCPFEVNSRCHASRGRVRTIPESCETNKWKECIWAKRKLQHGEKKTGAPLISLLKGE